MPGKSSGAVALTCALQVLTLACSSSDSQGDGSPDGGSGSATASGGGSGGAADGGRESGGAPSTSGGTSSGGTSSSGGANVGGSGNAAPGGSGGALPTCTPGCKTDCPQGCFDLGECRVAESARMLCEASVYTAGVHGTGFRSDDPVELYYRPAGSTYWWKGQPMTRPRTDTTREGMLFYLAPDSDYSVRLKQGVDEICSGVHTLEAAPEAVTPHELWVDASAAGGGDGAAAKPFRTIQEGVNAAGSGTVIHVKKGIYREEVRLTKTSTFPETTRILGEKGAIIDGADPAAAAGTLTWRDDGGGVYSAAWPGDPRYVSRAGKRLYHYTSLAGLQAGTGYNDVPIAEGFFVTGGRLHARLATAPGSDPFQVPVLNTAIQISGAEGAWIEGLEIRFYGEGDYGKGIDVTDGAKWVVVRGNHVHDIPTPVWVRKGSFLLRIEDNEMAQTNDPMWPWNAVKATDHENDAITVAGGAQTVVANNRIHDVFNGVYVGSFDDDENQSIAREVDVYRNRLTRIGDDGFEPEGATVNARFWENTVDVVHNGISLAPITTGPVYAFKNRFTDFEESGFKLSNDSHGPVFLYHNTCYTGRPDHNGMNVSGNFTNVTFRNNVLRGTSYGLELTFEVTGNDLDYDAMYTTRGAPRIKWNDVRYDDVPALCAATQLECHGVGDDPALVAPATGKFAPTAGSPLVDKAVRLYGINDSYDGNAPDMGYVETGATEVPPL